MKANFAIPTNINYGYLSIAVKISPGKQSQLRNFLSKGQMPPVRSTAPGTQTQTNRILTVVPCLSVGWIAQKCLYLEEFTSLTRNVWLS